MADSISASPPGGTAPARAAARKAGLRYVSDAIPGITRRRTGRAFSYRGPDGKPVAGKKTLARIRALAIPPAWSEVWIAPFAEAHLAATGRDAKGRKQYRYHDDFAAMRDAAKYDHLASFAHALPRIRKAIQRDLARRGLPREKVLAAVVALLEQTLIRIGNEDYAKANGSFGLTTLHNGHVRVKGAELRFLFRGKSGKDWNLSLRDRRVARIIRSCQELPGQHLFEYRGADGGIQKIASGDVNAYLREISGSDITAKDFRTWAGTVEAALAFQEMSDQGEAATKSSVRKVIAKVAARLGNTVAVCRKCYVHPRIVEAFADGKWPLALRTTEMTKSTGLSLSERAVLEFLERKTRK